MTQTAINYGIVLWQLAIPAKDILTSRAVFNESKELRKALSSPLISEREKAAVIDKIFPASMQSFLKVVCKYREAEILDEIFSAYQEYADRENNIIRGTLSCTQAPSEQQFAAIKAKLCQRFHAREVILNIQRDLSLIGGFVLRIGNLELDESIAGRWKRLSASLTRR